MEFFLYAVNPVLFLPFVALTIWVVAIFPILLYLVLAGVAVIILVPSLRQMGATYLSNNLIMLAALYEEVRGNKQLTWDKIEENRAGSVKV